MSSTEAASADAPSGAISPGRAQALSAAERRVLGVLVEKAKTTPDVYPMSLNGLVTGCNQKNNRHPVVQWTTDDVEPALDRLRTRGAISFVQGGGRVEKYRHGLYEWLGVDKVELAVVAELLLRGPQTEGELRAHASRMEPIADLTVLRGVLESLKVKGLIVPLTPEGRGHVVTHNLYEPREMDRLRAEHGGAAPDSAADRASPPAARATTPAPLPAVAPRAQAEALSAASTHDEIATLRAEIASLRRELAALGERVAEIDSAARDGRDEIERLKSALGV
jgi:uncharacterized protein YceH (UPF0502 family)